jgi:outer membrane autotransporter protein
LRFGGQYVFVEEDQCVWAKFRYRNLDFDHTKQQVGFDEDGGSVSGGVQGIIGPNWRLGFAAGYERADLETDTSQKSDGDRLHLGGVAKYIQGPLLLAGAVTGGFTSYDTTRPMSFGTFSGTTRSDNDVDYISGLFRAAYQVGTGPWYAKPMVDIDVTQVHLDGFTEHGSNAAMRVSGSDETVFSATPALELGRQSAFAGGTLVRTFVRGGVTFFGDDDFALRSNFVFSAGGVPSFTTVTSLGNVVGDVSAGVTFLAAPGSFFSANSSVTLSYDGRFGEDFQDNAVAAKASLKF